MANKLPYDDENDIVDTTPATSADGMTEDDVNTIAEQAISDTPDYDSPYVNGVDTRPKAALKYFTPQGSSDAKENEPGLQQPDISASTVQDLAAYNPNPVESTNIDLDGNTLNNPPRTNQPQVTNSAAVSPQASLLEQYKKLMDQKQNKNSNLDMQLGGNQIAQAIASGYGAKIGDGSDAIKAMKETANLPLEKLLGQGKVLELQNSTEINDPNSSISSFAREQALNAMKRLNPNMTDEQFTKLQNQFSGMTAKQLEQAGFKGAVAGALTPYQQMLLEINRRKLDQGAQRIEQGEKRLGLNTDKFGEQKSAHIGKVSQDFEKALDTMKLTKNSEAGRAAFSLGAARQLELVANSRPKGDYTDVEMREIANMANRMLTGGSSSAQAAVEELVPKSMVRQFKNWQTYLLNDPQSVEAKKFVDVFKKLADREKEYSTNVLNKYMKSKGPAFTELAEKAPDVYNQILDSKFQLLGAVNQVPNKSLTDIAKENNTPQTTTATQLSAPTAAPVVKQDNKITNYAKQHNLDYNAAKTILMGRGYQPNE